LWMSSQPHGVVHGTLVRDPWSVSHGMERECNRYFTCLGILGFCFKKL